MVSKGSESNIIFEKSISDEIFSKWDEMFYTKRFTLKNFSELKPEYCTCYRY